MPPRKKRLCFVLMPFKDDMKEVYWQAIKPACESANFTALRVDEVKGVYNINKKIIENIFSSDAIIADLTGSNPNVFYEMGVAHAIGNKTIMIIQRKEKVPFDVSTYHAIHYEQSESGLQELKTNIAEFLACIDEWRTSPTNPVQDFKPFDALVPASSLEDMQKRIKEKEKELANTVHRSEYEKIKTELEQTKQALSKRPLQRDISDLRQKVTDLTLQLKEQQIRVIRDEADKKEAVKKIIAPQDEMVLVPAGEFIMGTSDEQIEKYLKENKSLERDWLNRERPAHPVYLDDFYMEKYPVTNAQYAEFLNDWGKDTDQDGQKMIFEHKMGVHKVEKRWTPQEGFEKNPVINVTWYGSRQYALWAKKQLPTEAQWEKAARGGQELEYATRDGTLNHVLANYDRKNDGTTPVGSYPANPFGLYDMSGNVWEWCNDWYGEEYYAQCEQERKKTGKPVHNPRGPENGRYRVLRGGSWDNRAYRLRCANRNRINPRVRIGNSGFRCVRA